MKNTDLQLHLIEILDNVVARIEELVTSSEALNQINIDILKNDVRSLYKDICEIEQTELRNPADSVHKMKNSVNELKRKLELFSQENESPVLPVDDFLTGKPQEPDTFIAVSTPETSDTKTFPDEHPDFRPIVEESSTSPSTPAHVEKNRAYAPGPEADPSPSLFRETSEPLLPEKDPHLEKKDRISEESEPEGPVPETETMLHRISETDGNAVNRTDDGFAKDSHSPIASPFPDMKTLSSETEAEEMQETCPGDDDAAEKKEEFLSSTFQTETEPQDLSGQILGEGTPPTEKPEEGNESRPDLSEFIPSRDEEPSSYVTELTAMVQAQVGEQDMSKVAVSSTAMPDERIVNQVANRSGIFNKLKETQKLSSSDPQNALKSLVEKMKSNRTVNDVHQGSADSMKALIGINEKFLFLNQLFRGNVKEYNDLLQELDRQSGRTKAMEVLHAYQDLYNWDPETLPFLSLQNLIEKRFPKE